MLSQLIISNFNITGSDLYDLFGKYGPIRQVRLGTDSTLKTKGTAYVVFESPDDAREAMTHLNGFHLMERYIVGEFFIRLYS
jgi:pre-mRNA branch site protein p14